MTLKDKVILVTGGTGSIGSSGPWSGRAVIFVCRGADPTGERAGLKRSVRPRALPDRHGRAAVVALGVQGDLRKAGGVLYPARRLARGRDHRAKEDRQYG